MYCQCPNCRRVLKVGDELEGKQAQCPECGQNLTVPVRPKADLVAACPSCGANMPADAVFCVECGYDRRSGKTAQSDPLHKAGRGLSGTRWLALGAAVLVHLGIVALVLWQPIASWQDGKAFRQAEVLEKEAGDDYEKAIAAYEDYLKAYPDGLHVAAAREKAWEELPRKMDNRAYERAGTAAANAGEDYDKVIAAYREYLARFPTGRRVRSVEAKIRKAKKAMQQAKRIRLEEQREAEEARKRIEEQRKAEEARKKIAQQRTADEARKLLYKAAENGNRTEVERLLAQGADVNGADKLGVTALHAAAFEGHKDVVKVLLAKGADVNAKFMKNYMAPLHMAAWNGHVEVAEVLLANGADINAGSDMKVDPMSYAACKGHKDMVVLLVDKGANVNGKDKSGGTALFGAATAGHKDIVAFLLAKGADVNAKDDKGRTPLDGAMLGSNDGATMALLRKHGAKRGRDIK